MSPLPLDAETRAQMKQWVDNWQRVGPVLDAERLDQLRRLDDAESGRIARDLVWPMGTPGDDRGGDDARGLVPMKEVLQKLGTRR